MYLLLFYPKFTHFVSKLEMTNKKFEGAPLDFRSHPLCRIQLLCIFRKWKPSVSVEIVINLTQENTTKIVKVSEVLSLAQKSFSKMYFENQLTILSVAIIIYL